MVANAVFHRPWLGAALMLAFASALGISPAMAAADVTIEDDRITADLSQVPIAEVLRTVAEQTGAQLSIRGELGTVRPQAFSRVPLAEALPRLAQPNGVLLQFAPAAGGGRRLVAIRVVAPGAIGQASGGAEGGSSIPVGPTPVSQRDPHRGTGLWDYDKGEAALPDVDKRIAQLGEITRTRGAGATAAITYVLVGDPDPLARNAAIGLLSGLPPSPEGRQALIQAVADADPMVRTEALKALSRNRREKPVALLTQVIKGDADRQVRLAAIENLSGNDGELARAVLQGVLADPDAEMREAAKQALSRR